MAVGVPLSKPKAPRFLSVPFLQTNMSLKPLGLKNVPVTCPTSFMATVVKSLPKWVTRYEGGCAYAITALSDRPTKRAAILVSFIARLPRVGIYYEAL